MVCFTGWGRSHCFGPQRNRKHAENRWRARQSPGKGRFEVKFERLTNHDSSYHNVTISYSNNIGVWCFCTQAQVQVVHYATVLLIISVGGTTNDHSKAAAVLRAAFHAPTETPGRSCVTLVPEPRKPIYCNGLQVFLLWTNPTSSQYCNLYSATSRRLP